MKIGEKGSDNSRGRVIIKRRASLQVACVPLYLDEKREREGERERDGCVREGWKRGTRGRAPSKLFGVCRGQTVCVPSARHPRRFYVYDYIAGARSRHIGGNRVYSHWCSPLSFIMSNKYFQIGYIFPGATQRCLSVFAHTREYIEYGASVSIYIEVLSERERNRL